MSFPVTRPRRLRRTEGLRRLARETRLSPEQLVLPLFVAEGLRGRRPINSMPGVERIGVDEVAREAAEARRLGIGGLILFGIPTEKDPIGSEAWREDGVVQRALRAAKTETRDELPLIADTCLCEYTSHGHCGLIEGDDPESPSVGTRKPKNHAFEVANDSTLPLLARAAVSQAAAGADVIAPSDMMDGRVRAIRSALDESGFSHVPILSYAAKYASAFYGPFRDAAESAPAFGDRRGYQMDPGNFREALREVALDVEEGADAVMVKPALPCLDVIAAVRSRFDLPVWAYQVSGEYAMLKAAAERGWIDERRAMLEALLSIRRAGADIVITYWAKQAAGILAEAAAGS